MPDDPNAALIERMADAWYNGEDWRTCPSWSSDAQNAKFLASVDRDMSRVLAVVREHVGQELAEARAQIAALTAALRVEKGKSDDNA